MSIPGVDPFFANTHKYRSRPRKGINQGDLVTLFVRTQNMSKVEPILRRSHMFSKNVCQGCKRRRIKCDELRAAWLVEHFNVDIMYKSTLFNSSHSCVTTGRICIYVTQENSEIEESALKLWWLGSVEEACTQWRTSLNTIFSNA